MTMKRCLVTGGAGFIGSSIVKKLLEKGYELTIVDNLSNSNGKLIEDLPVEFIKKDISDPKIIETFKNYDFKYIFNFGSPSTDRFFNLDGSGVCETIKGFFNVIQIADNTGAESIVYPSSGTVYGNLPPPQSESMKLKPKSMYACTKAFLENFADTIKDENKKILGLRIFTGYGEGELSKAEYSRSVVTLFYLSISNNISPIVYGNGEQKRDFVYVEDIANIAIMGAEKKLSGVINVGSGNSTSFNELINILNLKLEKNIKPKYIPSPILHIDETKADISLLLKLLEYYPLKIDKGIDKYLIGINKMKKLFPQF